MYGKREALIEKRNQLGLSQQAIADKLGIPQSTYCSIENGVVNPSIENYHKIGKALGMNAFVLMNRINKDLDIYDKNEPLKVVQVSFRHDVDCINAFIVEDSSGTKKDLSIDEFNNIIYYRYKNGYSLNIDYQAHDCEEEYKTNKRQALIKRRKELGLTRKDRANKLGISSRKYYDIENGLRDISIKNCNKIGEVLGIKDYIEVYALLNRVDHDLELYDKNEPLKLIWIFVNGTSGACIDLLRVEDSHEEWKDLTLDQFSNILYYRYINKYSLNVTYQAHDSEELKLMYVKDKSQSLLTWCESQGDFGRYIINNVQLPYGITLADIYKSCIRKIKIKCPKHDIYEQTVADITRRKQGCPKCTASGTSYPEQFIYWSLKQLYPKCESRYKVDGLEVDVFIPEKNTCIEYNGYLWHKGKEYMDLQKRNHIESLGYKFIAINEHYENGDIILSGNNIDFYYKDINKNDRLKELVQYIADKLLQADSSLINFKEVEKNAWEYSKGKIAYEDSVANKFSCLVEEWDETNTIKPDAVSPGSHQYIMWRCKNCGNEWQARIGSRTHYKSGCPICGYNTFTGKINPHSKCGGTLQKKQPIAVVNGVEIYI